MHTVDQEAVNQVISRISEQAIRERAYELYEIRGCQEGHAEEDWYLAEAELSGRLLQQQAA
jgi:hypothetical protein